MMITAVDRWTAAAENIKSEVKRVSRKHGYASKKTAAIVRAESLFVKTYEQNNGGSWNGAMNVIRTEHDAAKGSYRKALMRVLAIMEEFRTEW